MNFRDLFLGIQWEKVDKSYKIDYYGLNLNKLSVKL